MDKDLTFLRYADPEDLRILTDYITMNRKGNPRFNERLTTTPEYARYYPDGLNNMVDSIVEEFQYYGGNTVLNFMRGRRNTARPVGTAATAAESTSSRTSPSPPR